MKIPFLKRKAKEEEKPKLEQVKIVTPLEQLCNEKNKSELYTPLSWTLLLNPSRLGKKIDELLQTESFRNYIYAANLMLYEDNLEKAKEYFNKAHQLAEGKNKEYLRVIVENFDDVAKIARECWEKEGAYKVEEKKTILT